MPATCSVSALASCIGSHPSTGRPVRHPLSRRSWSRFVLNSGYDSWQTNFIWFTPDGGKPVDPGWHSCAQTINTCNASQLAVIETFHEKFVAKLAPMVDPATPHGGFVESCMRHCQAWPTTVKYNGMTGLETLSAWHDGRAKAKVIDSPLLSGKGACQPPKA